jgi:hypothetical protein
VPTTNPHALPLYALPLDARRRRLAAQGALRLQTLASEAAGSPFVPLPKTKHKRPRY